MKYKQYLVAVLLTSVFIDSVGFSIIIPFLPFYAKSFGASALEIGALLGCYPLLGIIAPFMWGTMSDQFGHRTAIIINIFGTTLSFLLLALSNTLWILFLARILAGSFSSSIVIARSYVSLLFTTDKQTKTLSFVEAASGVGFVIGPFLGSFLAGIDPFEPDYRFPCFVAAGVSSLALCLAIVALPREQKRKSGFQSRPNYSLQKNIDECIEISQQPMIRTILIIVFTIFFAGLGIQAIFPLWCEAQFGWGTQKFGYFIAFYCLGTATFQISLTGQLSQRFGEGKMLLWALGLLILGLLLIAFSTTELEMLGVIPLLICAEAIVRPVLVSLLSKLSTSKSRGQVLGLMQSISNFAWFTGAVWTGFLFDNLGEIWPFLMSLIPLIIVFFWSRKELINLSFIL